MRRRTLLKGLLAAATGAPGFRLPLVSAAGHRGKFFVFVQAAGGWDPTSFCDPKTNTPGELVINRWAQHDDIRQVGNLFYAPFANNAAFFEKYYQRMLVINGVDAQTNAHSVGVVHNWTGRTSEGFPMLGALLAAYYAPALPIAYLSFGGFSATSGITRFTRIDNATLLRDIAYPATDILSDADWAALESYRAATAERRAATPNLLPASERYLAFYQSAFVTEGLKAYADAIPPEDQLEQEEQGPNNLRSTLREQAQLTVLAFKTGVAVSADLFLDGFDTHENNDPQQDWLLGNLTGGVDYPVGLRRSARRGRPHGGGDGFGLWPHQLLQRGGRQGPLAYRQLRHHGEEPALDQSGGGRD